MLYTYPSEKFFKAWINLNKKGRKNIVNPPF